MKDRKYPALVIFGPPGSGKGTQSALLKKLGSLYHLSTGEMMRNLPTHTEELRQFREVINAGKLIANDDFMKIFEGYLAQLIENKDYNCDEQWLLLDGVPRSVEQAQGIENYIDVKKIISLELNDQEALFQRLMSRGKSEGRADDLSPDILKTRMEKYHEVTAPVLGHYSDDLIIKVNALQQPLEVFRDILNDLASDLPFKL